MGKNPFTVAIMIPDNLADLPFADMLDLLPDGVVCHEAVRNEAGTIVDFRLIYYNKAFEAFAPAPYKRDPGLLMLADNPGQEAILEPTMRQYVRVVETGDMVAYVFRDPYLNASLSLRARKLGDGVLVTLRDVTAQEQAAQQAQIHTSLLQGILNTSLHATIVVEAIRDAQGVIIDFRFPIYNQIARDTVLAQIGKEIPSLTLLSAYPTSYKEGMFLFYKQVTETEEPMRMEHFYPQIDKWYDISMTKLNDGCVVTFMDITESKRLFHQTEQQANFVNSILDGSLNSIMAYESVRNDEGKIIDFRVVLANHAAETYLETNADELNGRLLLDLYPEELDMGLFDQYVETVETGRPFRREANYQTNGVDSWLDLSATKLGDGCVVTFTDISMLKQAFLEIERQAEFVSKLLDGSLNGLVSLDPIRAVADDPAGQLIDLRILSANRAAEAFLGKQEADIVGYGLLELYPQCMDMGLFALFERVLKTRCLERMEAYLQNNRVELWLDVSATPRDGDGLVVSFLNITERKIAQRQTEALVQELQKTNKNLEEFAYVASHDLQEPLRKVVAFGDMLRNQFSGDLGPEGVDIVRRMQLAAGRMQTLIKDLLTYSRITSTKESFSVIDLNQVLADVLVDLELIIEDKKAILTSSHLPTIYGDNLQLHQLFQNLLSNALKFTRTEVVPQLQIKADVVHGFDLVRPDGSLPISESMVATAFHRIQVIDNGIGFDSRYAEQIFEVFQRLHTRAQYTGTGIGLSIVRKVVENHQGYIIAEGQPGVGATFTILVPIKSL